MDVDVPPGCNNGTKIIFPSAGHERRDGSRQDIIFLIEEVEHARLSRSRRADLTMHVRLPWLDNLNEKEGKVYFKGVDGQELVLTVNYAKDRRLSGTCHFPSAGMLFREGTGRGKLVVR